MPGLDQRTELSFLYKVSAKAPVSVDVPDLLVLALDGTGDPAVSPLYQASVTALMAMSWGVRAHLESGDPPLVITVMPLEGVWTLPGIPFAETPEVRAQLQWSLQVVQPGMVTGADVEAVRATVRRKKPALDRIEDVRLARVPGGPAAAMLHVGPYVTEPTTLASIHAHIEASGGTPIWGHREIYLNDPRRTAPDTLKTILRVGIAP